MALTKISTGGVKDDAASQAKIADEAIDEARLQISNAGSNGEFLQKQSGNTGGLTWAAANQYTHPNHSGEVTSTADGAQVIADDVVDEANLKISNAGSNGQFLSKQSGNTGGLTWADVSAAPEIDLVADGAIAANKPVIIKSNGKAAEIVETISANDPTTDVGSEDEMVAGSRSGGYGLVRVKNSRWVATYRDGANNSYPRYSVGTLNTSTGDFDWSEGSSPFNTSAVELQTRTLIPIGDDLCLWMWRKNSDSVLYLGVGEPSTSANSCTWTWNTDIGAVSGQYQHVIEYLGNNQIGVLYKDSDDDKLYIRIGTVNTTTKAISFGTALEMDAQVGSYHAMAADTANKKIMYLGLIDDGGDGLHSCIITYDTDNSVSKGSWVDVEASLTTFYQPRMAFDPNVNRFFVIHSSSDEDGYYRVGNYSGTTPSWSSKVEFKDSNTNYFDVVYHPIVKKMIAVYSSEGDSYKNYSVAFTLSNSDNTATVGTANQMSTSSNCYYNAVAYDTSSDSEFVVTSYRRSNNPKTWTVNPGTATTNLTADNFVGFAKAAISDTATGTIQVASNTNSGQSGLTAGTKYYVQKNGTLGTAAASPSVTAGVALSSSKILIK